MLKYLQIIRRIWPANAELKYFDEENDKLGEALPEMSQIADRA